MKQAVTEVSLSTVKIQVYEKMGSFHDIIISVTIKRTEIAVLAHAGFTRFRGLFRLFQMWLNRHSSSS